MGEDCRAPSFNGTSASNEHSEVFNQAKGLTCVRSNAPEHVARLFGGLLEEPADMDSLCIRLRSIRELGHYLAPPPPPSKECPGVYQKGCSGSLVLARDGYADSEVWICGTQFDYASETRCSYRYYPRPRIYSPQVEVILTSCDTIRVQACKGAEDSLRACGGVATLLKLAGVEETWLKGARLQARGTQSSGNTFDEIQLTMYENIHRRLLWLDGCIKKRMGLNYPIYKITNGIPPTTLRNIL